MSLKDKIFGREKLKQRISALESKVEGLEAEKEELDKKARKENKRAKEAVSKRQDLEKKINRQEDKIQSLKDELRKKELVEETTGVEADSHRLGRDETEDLLSKLGSMESEKEDLFTVFLPSGATIQDLNSQGFLQTSLTLNQLRRLKNEKSETGKVFFHCKNLFNVLIKPPVPMDKGDWVKDRELVVKPVKEKLKEPVGFVFVSSGGSAAALFGEGIEESRLVESQIKGKHKKGGFSQDRFERARREEVKKHLNEVVDACDEVVPENVEKVAVSGSRRMVDEIKGMGIPGDAFERALDLSSIENDEDLRRAFEEFWKTGIVHL
ncbi:MAG: Vms1/Ankzf1 family peptidyl-tRNA hydrolase [Candidatus Aenigmatarchaeota archaeon]